MSKEVLFAGILAVACLVLVAVAFLAPHKTKPIETVKTETTETVAPEGDTTGAVTATATTTATGGSTTSSLIAQGTTGGTMSGGGFTSATGTTTGGYTAAGTTTGGYTSAGTTGAYTGGGTSSAFTAGKSTAGFSTGGGTGSFSTGAGTTGSFSGGSGATGSSTGGNTTTSITASEKTHVVAANETLAEISQKYYNTSKRWKDIQKANPGVDPNTLKVGQKLIIPALTAADTATSTTSVTTAPGERTYTVQKNDSYYVIAQKELGAASRWKEIQKLNGIAPEDLHVGQVIKLPSKQATTSLPTSGGSDTPASGKVHVVAAGETLSDIAAKELGTSTRWKEILKANPGVDPDTLKVGQRLAMPEATSGHATGTDTAGTYTVMPGDDLQKIAEKQLGSRNAWRRIADANPGVDAKHLRVGQVLKIPGKGVSDDTRPAHPLTTAGASTAGSASAGSASAGGSATFGTTGGSTSFGTTGGTTAGTSSYGTSAYGTTGGSATGARSTAGATTSGGFTATTGGTTAGHVGPP